MKKFTGNYSADAGKALKSAGGRIFCKVDEDGMIYTCTGYFVYRMRPDEYAATVQPVTKCDAGNWIIENGEKREAGPADFDVIKTFRDTVNACTGAVLDRGPADFTADLRSRRLTLRGDSSVNPIVETDSRYGPITDGRVAGKTRSVLHIAYASGKRAIYDFSGVQYHSF